jgi:hypothetical protein
MGTLIVFSLFLLYLLLFTVRDQFTKVGMQFAQPELVQPSVIA